jgi:hypothetical protein
VHAPTTDVFGHSAYTKVPPSFPQLDVRRGSFCARYEPAYSEQVPVVAARSQLPTRPTALVVRGAAPTAASPISDPGEREHEVPSTHERETESSDVMQATARTMIVS